MKELNAKLAELVKQRTELVQAGKTDLETLTKISQIDNNIWKVRKKIRLCNKTGKTHGDGNGAYTRVKIE